MFAASRARFGVALAAGLWLCLGAVPRAEAGGHEVRPPADWVLDLPLPPLPESTSGEGVDYLLFDRQVDFRGSEQAYFTRVAKYIASQGALADEGQIEIEFDPAFESVVLHAVRVQRDGQWLDRLATARIEQVQRQPELESRIFDGTHTLILFLSDLRRGDILDYSFTLRGQNPALASHRFTSVSTSWSVPLERFHFRVLWPGGSRPLIAAAGDLQEPVVRELGEFTSYEWGATQVGATLADGEVPQWYESYGWIQLTDFQDWGSVARWAVPLYPHASELPDEARAWVTATKAAHPEPQVRAMRALRFVQDEVRYLGIELGAGSFVPSVPGLVLERRFGDCKDKTALLVALLDAMEIPASPALVNTRVGRGLDRWAPSPRAFDHVITTLVLDGERYWLDPTGLYDRGALEQYRAGGYERALVVEPDTTELSSIPLPDAEMPSVDIRQHVGLGGLGDSVSFEVETRYRGFDANQMRYRTQTTSREQLEKDYLNYYADLYPEIELAEPLAIHDDEDANEIRIVEHYEIADFWLLEEDESAGTGELTALELYGPLEYPDRVRRSAPLGVDHPIHTRYEITASLPDGWSIPDEEWEVAGPALALDYRSHSAGTDFVQRWVLSSRADHVPPDRVAEHVDLLDRMRDSLSFPIAYDPVTDADRDWTNPDNMNWPVLVLALAVVGGVGALGVFLFRWRPPPRVLSAADAQRAEAGIGGWLALVALGVCVQPVTLLLDVVPTLESYLLPTWTSMVEGDGLFSSLVGLLLFELLANVAAICFSVVNAVLFFGKRRAFPYCFPALLLFLAGVGAVDLSWCHAAGIAEILPGEIADVVRTAVMSLVWASYMAKSVRVKKTFVN